MTSFNDKEKAAENKYAHDKETEFKIRARRDKLLGFWVAEKMGLKSSAAEEYARALATLNIEHAHQESLLAKIKDDLNKGGAIISEHDIRAQMHHLLLAATQEVAG